MKKISILDAETLEFAKKINNINKCLKKIKGNKVLIYGAGAHSEQLLSCFNWDKYFIRVCDGFKSGKILNLPIERSNQNIIDWADSVVISSFEKQKEIFEFLINKYRIDEDKIICLYEKDEKLPFYKIEIEMDAEKLSDITEENQYGKINKYDIWKNPGRGKRYEAEVEKSFFSTVTKNYYLSYIEVGDNVLDVGAGTGRLSVEVYNAGANVVSVDTSEEMLKIINEKEKNIKTVVVDNVELPFDDLSFDKVVSCDAIVHFLNWKDFLREHARVLKEDGYIVYNMINDEHLQFISKDKRVHSSYITGGTGYYATVTRNELEKACAEIGTIELVKMIPYNFFGQTAYSYGILSRKEMMDLYNYYNELCKNRNAAKVISRFENEIVSKLPEYYTACNICVFKKKGGTRG